MRGTAAFLLLFGAACGGDGFNEPRSEQPLVTLTDSAVAWLRSNAAPLTSVALNSSGQDLQRLKTMIGSARMVGMGEATHGTREFFQAKARVFRFLVEKMGFDGIAVEGNLPEAHELDVYVRTGVGDPRAALARMHFWVLRHEEMYDLILWMRSYNSTRGPADQIGFYGMDEQFPGAPLDSVVSFVQRVAGDTRGPFVRGAYDCVWPYRNFGLKYWTAQYASTTPSYRNACRASLQLVSDSLAAWRPQLTAASSADEVSLIQRFAQVLLQWEAQGRGSAMNPIAGFNSRDSAMADNALWVMNRLGPSSRVMLWAHNYHVARDVGNPNLTVTGARLRKQLGSNYLSVGFMFGEGGVYAYGNGALRPQTAPPPDPSSYEAALRQVGLSAFYFDARQPGSAIARWLAGPRTLREIGATYEPETPEKYLSDASLSGRYDIVIYHDTVTPSSIYPVPPGVN